MILGYLTSLYGRTSDTFIRTEVAELRALGHEVHTFSIRRAKAADVVSDEARREQARTEYVLQAGAARLASATLAELARRPVRLARAARLAIKIGTPGLKGRLWPIAYLIEATYLAGRLRAKGIEHLHNHIGEGSAAVAMLAADLAGIPFSMTIHGPGEFDKPGLLALDEKVHRAAFVAGVSEFGRSQLYRWSDHRDWPKIAVIRDALSGAFLDHRPTPPPASARLVYVGRLVPEKGSLLLVEAAGRLAAEGLDFELRLVGDGPLRPDVEGLIARRGLAGRVQLLGWRDTAEVRRELEAARALVLPSFAEGLPVAVMEALALGRPAITTAIAGIPELVESGACGWLIPAGSIDALTNAIREALAAPVAELERMGLEGARRVAVLHDARIEARKLDALFAGSRPDPPGNPGRATMTHRHAPDPALELSSPIPSSRD